MYSNEQEALHDVLRLSTGMSLKSAAAGLDLGGGKAVIIGDPIEHKTERLLRAYGRMVDSLGGRYITAEDVGTTTTDMVMIRRETRHVAGLSIEHGGSGDPSPATARGVMAAMQSLAARLWGDDELVGRTIVLQGVGKVGTSLVERLTKAGATVIATDVNAAALEYVRAEYGTTIVATDEIWDVECDVFSPCAMGGALNEQTIPRLRCEAVVPAGHTRRRRPPRRPRHHIRSRLRRQRRRGHQYRPRSRWLRLAEGRSRRRCHRRQRRLRFWGRRSGRRQPGDRRGSYGRDPNQDYWRAQDANEPGR
jgi:leucine dehydrogenase